MLQVGASGAPGNKLTIKDRRAEFSVFSNEATPSSMLAVFLRMTLCYNRVNVAFWMDRDRPGNM